MDDNEIKFKNRKFDKIDKEILEKTLSLLSENKSYYYNSNYILKYRKNDRD